MYQILKKYMSENFSSKYTEKNNVFSFYSYYSNMGTFVKHYVYADKERFRCIAQLPYELLFEDDYYDFQISAIAKVNNDIERGYVEVNEDTKELFFYIDFKPVVKYSEFTKNYYIENLDQLMQYGEDVLDDEFGEILNNSISYWWTA